MRRHDVEVQLLHQPRKARGLSLWQVQHQPGERGRVDDRVLQRTLQAAAHEPRVERVVAVLDEDRALGKTQEAAPRVFEFGGADEHRTVDVVALAGVRVDRRAAVDQGVKEREGPVESKALGPDLEDEEGSVAGRLDVEGYELRVLQQRLATDLRRIDRDLLPWHELTRAAWFEIKRTRAHRASARARRAHAISSPLSARRSSTAAV